MHELPQWREHVWLLGDAVLDGPGEGKVVLALVGRPFPLDEVDPLVGIAVEEGEEHVHTGKVTGQRRQIDRFYKRKRFDRGRGHARIVTSGHKATPPLIT